jgi:hypothetical protein
VSGGVEVGLDWESRLLVRFTIKDETMRFDVRQDGTAGGSVDLPRLRVPILTAAEVRGCR